MTDVDVIIDNPVELTLSQGGVGVSNIYIQPVAEGFELQFTNYSVSLTLGLGKTSSAFPRSLTFTPPIVSVSVGSNLNNISPIFIGLINNVNNTTILDSNFILDYSQTSEFYESVARMRSENWDSSRVPEAIRNYWSENITSSIDRSTARKVITTTYNRYKAPTVVRDKTSSRFRISDL